MKFLNKIFKKLDKQEKKKEDKVISGKNKKVQKKIKKNFGKAIRELPKN